MKSMKIRTEGTWSRSRRHGIIAGLIALVALTAGCSASEDSAADTAKAADVLDEQAYMGADGGEVPAAAPEGEHVIATDRSMIVTGTLYMTVEDPIEVADKAQKIVDNAGGRIDARNEIAPDERDGGSATLTLRIPTQKLSTVVADLKALGTVDSYQTDSLDVSTQVTDLDARISTLKASTARIQKLLDQAKDIPDIITLENELSMRQAELESLQAQQRGLKDQVSLSTITLSLTTEPVVVVEEDDSPSNFWEGLVEGWSGLVSFISGALVVLGVMLPWLILMAVIAAAIIGPLRLRRKRSAKADARAIDAARTTQPPFASGFPAAPGQGTTPAATHPAGPATPPQAPQGPQGPQAPQGPQGPQAPQGPVLER